MVKNFHFDAGGLFGVPKLISGGRSHPDSSANLEGRLGNLTISPGISAGG